MGERKHDKVCGQKKEDAGGGIKGKWRRTVPKIRVHTLLTND